MTVLLLGTRRSQLARTQSGLVADALTRHGHEVSLVEIVTEGDRSRAALAQIGGTGVFVGALRAALRTGEVDFAVHSLKDLPTEPEPDLVIAAFPMRVDPRDALVARDGLTLGELPAGAAIGTGSPRRAAQLAALGLGHTVAEIRGNVDTRLGYVRDGVLDAVILARAGLVRLGLAEAITETSIRCRCCLRRARRLAVECRADRPDLVALLSVLDDPTLAPVSTRNGPYCEPLRRDARPPWAPSRKSPKGKMGLRSSCGSLWGPRTARSSCAAR